MTGWVILELFGHVRLVGEVSEVDAFGGKLGRIDVLRDDGSAVTQFFGAASVYRLTPTDEATARSLVAPRPALPYTWEDEDDDYDSSTTPGAPELQDTWEDEDDDYDSSKTPGAQVNAQTGSEDISSFHPRRRRRLHTTMEPHDAGDDTDVAPAPEPREAL